MNKPGRSSSIAFRLSSEHWKIGILLFDVLAQLVGEAKPDVAYAASAKLLSAFILNVPTYFGLMEPRLAIHDTPVPVETSTPP